MNDILQLKGHFKQRSRNSQPGPSNIPRGQKVAVEHLKELKDDLMQVADFWRNDSLNIMPLVSVYYTDVVAKSNRIKCLLTKGSVKANDSIVGAKFANDTPKHIITHCVGMDVIQESIDRLSIVIQICKQKYGNEITHDIVAEINEKRISIPEKLISRTKFVNTIVDAYHVEKFGVEQAVEDLEESAIVTIYKTGTSTQEIMRRLKISYNPVRSLDETTMLLLPDQYRILKEKAPYLIAMGVRDLSTISREDVLPDVPADDRILRIPRPSTEPIIGVIDTQFDDNVYFSEWVEYKNMLDPNIPIEGADYNHGTKVSSLIVDGPSFNRNLDDGCGRFRVRHFGVAKEGKFSSFTVLRCIKEAVAANRDIKVWNLSLGSDMPISKNFISPEAAILDQIQYENDVVFIIAGTNDNTGTSKGKAIGSPADSINGLVVNAVDFNDKPASYSRRGPVLSFFNKPDVSYYGGDKGRGIRTCSPLGESMVTGTSYAAPWITRKMAYLIYVMGLSREVAKALIIDAAAGWKKPEAPSNVVGYGVVPIRIEEIIKSRDSEIKFILTGTSEKYDTYNFNIPVPIFKEKQPFVAKATLCYFPKCSRNQGVDYTNTEMDLHFGRIKGTEIKAINNNEQGAEGFHPLYEGNARRMYRKWDNIKHIGEELKTRTVPKKVYEGGLWGISIKTKERLNSLDGHSLPFGIVITLREMKGVNRIDEFIRQCAFRGWLVNRINVDNCIDIYNKAEEKVIFE